MYRLCDPKMCSQTKFVIPRIYARDTIFSRSDGSGKGVTLNDPKCIKIRILAFLPKIM